MSRHTVYCSLRKRASNGMWQVYCSIPGEKPHIESLGTKDKRIANIRLKEFKEKLLSGKVISINSNVGVKLKVAAEEFLEHILPEVEPSTYTLYDVALRKCLDCWGEDKPVAQITDRDIDKLIGDMRRGKLAAPTINKNLRHVKAFLKRCYRWKYMVSPIDFPKKLKEKEELRYLTVEQLHTLIGSITDTEFQDFILFNCYTGCRSGETIRLRWDDIDNPVDFIRIDAKQKNKTESRIPINAHARAILDRCKERGGFKVFRFESVGGMSHKFKDACRKVGLDNIREHDLRHTFASHLAMQGVSLLSLQQLMRHKGYQSTLIYSKLSPQHLQAESEKLNFGPMVVKK